MERKTRAVTCTFQTKLSDTQTGPHSFEGAKKNGKCENYITIKLNVFPQCFGLYVMWHRQLGFLLNPLLQINVICWLGSWYSEKL